MKFMCVQLPFVRAVRIAPLVALVVFAASCSSGGSSGRTSKRSDARQVLDAARDQAAGTSGEISGRLSLGTGPQTPLRGAWSGDLHKGRGTVNAQVAVAGVPTIPVEMRWIGGRLYANRAPLNDADRPKARNVSFLVRSDAEKPWIKIDLKNPYGEAFGRAFAPASLLAHLATRSSQFTVAKNEQLHGQKVTHLTSKGPVSLIGLWVPSQVDLWIDGQHRLARVALTAPQGTLSYDVSNYGTPVTVSAPPAAEIATSGNPNPHDLATRYATVKSGTANGVTWQLQRARASDGSDCWLWKATPAITQVIKDRNDGARCITPPSPTDDPADATQFVVVSDGSGPYSALGVLLPANTKALTLGFVGGKLQSVPVPTQASSPFVWTGPTSPQPAYLEVTLADGSKLECGAGSISSAGDLFGIDDAEAARLAKSPWACIPAQG
jgi:hypothetical protein